MSPEEFERLKAEEKAHLHQLRALKQQHRDVQRKAQIVGAVRGMRNADLEASTDALTDQLMRDAALQEARVDLAMESDAGRAAAEAQTEADREALRQSQAAELIRQMKVGLGASGQTATPTGASTADASATPKTIGRTPPPAADAPADAGRDAKTIGRRPQ